MPKFIVTFTGTGNVAFNVQSLHHTLGIGHGETKTFDVPSEDTDDFKAQLDAISGISYVEENDAGDTLQLLTAPGTVHVNATVVLITTSNTGGYENVIVPDGVTVGQRKVITFLIVAGEGDHLFIDAGPGFDLINQNDSVEIVWDGEEWKLVRFTGSAEYD